MVASSSIEFLKKFGNSVFLEPFLDSRGVVGELVREEVAAQLHDVGVDLQAIAKRHDNLLDPVANGGRRGVPGSGRRAQGRGSRLRPSRRAISASSTRFRPRKACQGRGWRVS